MEEEDHHRLLVPQEAMGVASREASGSYPTTINDFVGVRLNKPWVSLIIVLWIDFLDSVAFSIIIPSLWPYIQHVCHVFVSGSAFLCSLEALLHLWVL